MKIHYLQHLEIEGLGSIEDWALSKNHSLSVTRLYKNESFPKQEDFHWLIIMGGPMSVNDANDYPWLIREKIFIRKAIEAGKTVIGICLGAQLIASALGAHIWENEFKEIGWFPIRMTSAARSSDIFSHLPETIDAFHWHGETFDLPKDATRIAGSEACVNQAFSIGNSVFGFQFHLETTEKGAEDFISHFTHELVPAPYIQPPEVILRASARFNGINTMMRSILNKIEMVQATI